MSRAVTVAERRLAVHDSLWRGRSRSQIARIMRVPLRTVVSDIIVLRMDGVQLPKAGEAVRDLAR